MSPNDRDMDSAPSGSVSGERSIKTLPLWQPWASLVACGAKRIETRSWKAPGYVLGRRIAIHATKTTDWLQVCHEWPFNQYVPEPDALPLGALVATVIVDRCSQITEDAALELERRNCHELAFGNYEPGRWAWVLRDPEPLPEPVPFRGSQGIFDVPASLLGAAAPPDPSPALFPEAEPDSGEADNPNLSGGSR